MSQNDTEQLYNFLDATKYDKEGSEVSGGVGGPALEDNVGQQYEEDFGASGGFTFDSAKVIFEDDQLKQKDQRPAGFALYDNFTDEDDAAWGLGTLARTLIGGATISAWKVICSGGVVGRGCDHNGDNFGSIGAQGKIDIIAIPDFDGTPGVSTQIFQTLGGTANQISILVLSTGSIQLRMWDSSGVMQINSSAAKNDWESGTPARIVLAFKSGDTRLAVDNSEVITSAVAYTRTTAGAGSGYRIGTNSAAGLEGHFDFDNYFTSSVATYTYEDTYSDYVYVETKATLPLFPYTGPGAVRGYTAASSVGSSTARWIHNGKYWNGTQFAPSNDSYAQASPISDVNTNIAGLAVSDPAEVDVVFPNQSVQGTVSSYGLTYTGQKYPALSSIVPTTPVMRDQWLDWEEDTVKPLGTDVTYAWLDKINGIYRRKYLNTITDLIEDSDGSPAQTNTIDEINAGATGVLSEEVLSKPYILFQAVTGTRPTINQLKLGYAFNAVETDTTKTRVFWRLRKPDDSPATGVTCTIEIDRESVQYREASSRIMAPRVIRETDEEGEASAYLIRSKNFETSDGSSMPYKFKAKKEGEGEENINIQFLDEDGEVPITFLAGENDETEQDITNTISGR